MRGTLLRLRLDWREFGIIPAYAGNTLPSNGWPWSMRDHPRVCGEHTGGSQRMMHNPGSSPRMRGTRISLIMPIAPTGIIPAYAGNTELHFVFSHQHWDHPRVCGEHSSLICFSLARRGSSPRMRGTPADNDIRAWVAGIIPAYAGNT